MTGTVELSQQEAQQAIDLLDIATQARGLAVAPAALNLRDKIVAAFQEEPAKNEHTNADN